MREDFRCITCGHNFEYDFSTGKEKAVACPECSQLWKIESKLGRFRLMMWV
ncbi:MAG: zinc ribbon domain-containing protein [Candidatus Peribacteraceae bacterium]|nr:zinc ribbon domain-containing protein [Candidatus Peribacteraceae bacterium]